MSESDDLKMRIRKQIDKGTVILKEKPFVYALSSKLRTTHCDYCLNSGEFQKCSGCQYVYYCNKDCQREGWSIHKLECKALKHIAPRIVPDTARIMARLVKILQKGGDTQQSFYTNISFRTYKDLMSHYPNLKNDQQRMEHFTSLCGVLSEFLGEESLPNTVSLLGMYGRVAVNSFQICSQDLQTLGTGIYLGASVIDHSCRPNAVAVFEGTTIYIRTLQKLPYLDWSEIFINYIDGMATTEERQLELEKNYYFTCQCPKCLEPENRAEILGAACPNGQCDNAIDVNSELQCTKCHTEVTEDFVEAFKEVMEFTQEQLQNMKDLAYLDVCKICLKKQSGLLYRYNVKHVKTLDMAFESAISLGQLDDAKEYGLQLIEGYRRYYGECSQLNGLLHLKLGKIFAYHDNLEEAMRHLRIAYDVLKITHGIHSKIFDTELMPLLHECRHLLNNSAITQ